MNLSNPKRSILRLVIICLLPFWLHGQEFTEGHSTKHKPQLRGAIMMANSHIPAAKEGGKSILIVPTWGVDVDYFFHKRWSVAVQSDIKLQSFEIEDNNVMLKRSFPVAVAGVIHFHTKRHWSFFAGPGYEFENDKNLFLVKTGTEYSFEINENVEIALNFMYENKVDFYDTWTFGIAFNKCLWRKK